MPTSYRALCSDFYINLKMNVRMELPSNREPVLDLFERVRRSYPAMSSFRRYKDELALESAANASPHQWMAIRSSSVRAGVVNPSTEAEMYGLHRVTAEVSPYYLSISPLDLEYIELLYGFDLQASGNHNAIVASSLLGGSPLSNLVDSDSIRVTDCQPMVGMSMTDESGLEAHFEVKTRSKKGIKPGGEPGTEPISVYLTVRKYDPVTNLDKLVDQLNELVDRGQQLVDEHAVPNLLMPLREEIASSSF